MSERMLALARVLALLCVLAALWLHLRGWATAQSLSRSERALALGIAKVAANESSLTRIRPANVALIHQVSATHGTTARARLAWLRSHSPCVLGARDVDALERPGNCRWTRTLTDSGVEPSGWSEVYPHLPWSRYRGRWAQVREIARRLVSGQLVLRPCEGTPWTWGGPMDHARALERGLIPLDCLDPQTGARLSNTGFARAGS